MIKTEAEHEAILKRIDTILQAEPGEPEAIERDVLVRLVEAYEEERYPIQKKRIDGFAAIGPGGYMAAGFESPGYAWFCCFAHRGMDGRVNKADLYRLGYRVWPVRVELINGGPKK